MKVLKWLLILIVAGAAALAGIGFFLPDKAHVERSIVIDRPPATVYTVLNGFRRFNEWSPWANLDPKAITTYEGPPIGVGSKMSWASEDPNVGSGSQEILEVEAPSFIKLRLIFADFESDNTATYKLEPEGAGTKLTWSYDTDFRGDLMGRWFGTMLDSMLGPDYEKGLAKLKGLVEMAPAVDLAGFDVQVEDMKPIAIASVAGTTTTEPADIGKSLGEAYAKITAAMTANGLKQAQAPLAITRKWAPKEKVYEYVAGIPVDKADAALPDGDVKMSATPSGLTLKVKHVGPYDQLTATYDKLMAWEQIAGFKDNGGPWEQYVSDPGSTPAAELVTLVHLPVK
ncbi:MAG TPA: SRPBCC family protein [Nevskiaceae bacterium]|nr:SRPBCC family protein [Nevskiaceae bacterium]